jgi:MoxR-like ATPase
MVPSFDLDPLTSIVARYWGHFMRKTHFVHRPIFAQNLGYKPAQPDGWSSDKGCVLLIDEIDKADSDVPNSLLETLGNRSFSVPWVEKRCSSANTLI